MRTDDYDVLSQIDWSKVAANLRSEVKHLKPLSRKLGRAGSSLSMMLNYGHKPKFEYAIMILDLHYDLCREKHTIEQLRL